MRINDADTPVVSFTPLAEQCPDGQQQPVGVPARIDLPACGPRLTEHTEHEGCHSFTFSRKLTGDLKKISGQEHVDLFITLLAAFNILLARYASKGIDLCMPIITGLRERGKAIRRFRPSPGALGASLTGDPTFRALLRRVDEIVRMVSRQHDMGARMAEIKTAVDSNSTICSLRQVFFAMDLFASESEHKNKRRLDQVESILEDSELRVFLWQEDECLKGVVAYKAKLFDEGTIQRLAEHYATLLKNAVDNPDQDIGTLPLLNEAERQQLLVEWNDTESEYPENLCVHQLFETQARNTPDAVAVVFGNRQLTYSELNDWANHLARKLQKLGVGPEALVALYAERSVEMLVGILGILKSGGAYVPLDTIHPDKRLSAILSEAQPRALLTQGRLISGLLEYAGPVIVIDGDSASLTEENCDNLANQPVPENLAYVMFTSGSTGVPKGVLLSHRSLVNHSTAMAHAYGLQPSDRVLQFASVGFDVTLEEIFPTWLAGGTVVIRPEIVSVNRYLDFVEEQKITVLNLPASYWHEWVSDSKQLRVPPTVRLIIVGSEEVSREKWSIWKQEIGDRVRLYNAYGATETAITATIYDLCGDRRHGMKDCVPIGRPISNTKVYVLDERLNPVPIGVPGELYVGGVGLARGYLNRPGLTAERFLANPFCAETNARIYKSRDVVRYLPDGNLEYLGRIGNRVKLRGYSVDLEEIETVLKQFPGVRNAAVTVREDIPENKRLVAYVVQEPERACTAEKLRDELRQKLPDYMVPSAFVMSNSFPLTSSGKVDREALLDLERVQAVSENLISPRDSIERQLVSLWEEVLATRPISVQDNFFNLGGNSLIALKLMSRIRKRFKRDIPLTILYRATTVEKLAKLIVQLGPVKSITSLVPIQDAGSKPPFFWVHGDSSNAFLPRFLGKDQPLYGLMHQSQDGKPARYTEVESIAAHYLQEMRTVQAAGPYLLGGYSFGGTLAVEMARQLKTQGEEVSILFLLDPEFPVRTISGPCNRPKRVPFLHEARRHLRNLAPLGYRDKLVYILVRLRSKIKNCMQRFERIRRISKIILCKLYVRMGGPLPVFLRSTYILDIYGRALETYAPQPYPGPTIYCKVKNGSGDSGAGCEKLFTGKLSVQEFDVDHLDLVEESGVPLWAEELKDALQAVQDTANDKKYQVSSQCVKK